MTAPDPNAATRTLDSPHELRVRIPTRHYMLLHKVRILTGNGISDTVTRALEDWFRETPERRSP